MKRAIMVVMVLLASAMAYAAPSEPSEPETSDVPTLLSRGLAKYRDENYKGAGKDLEKAYSILSSRAPSPLTRQVARATAACALKNDNPMRAAKIIGDLMKSTQVSHEIDEELLNDLGTALTHASEQARLLQVYDEAIHYYMDSDRRLDKERDNKTARWGTLWIDETEAREKWKAYQDASRNLAVKVDAYRRAEKAVEVANDHYQEITGGLRLHGTLEIQQYQHEMVQALKNGKAAKKALDSAQEKYDAVEKPPFPESITIDDTADIGKVPAKYAGKTSGGSQK